MGLRWNIMQKVLILASSIEVDFVQKTGLPVVRLYEDQTNIKGRKIIQYGDDCMSQV